MFIDANEKIILCHTIMMIICRRTEQLTEKIINFDHIFSVVVISMKTGGRKICGLKINFDGDRD